MLEAGLASLLVADNRISSLCSDRLIAVVLDDESPVPAISYTVLERTTDQTLDGTTGLETVALQFNVWADRYTDVSELSESLDDILLNFQGKLSNESFVRAVTRGATSDSYEQQSRRFQRSNEFRVHYQRGLA